MERCESVGTDEGICFYFSLFKHCIAATESHAADLFIYLFIYFCSSFQARTQTAALPFQQSFFPTSGRDLLEAAGEAHLGTCSARYCCQLALRHMCSFCPLAPFHPDSRDSLRLFFFAFCWGVFSGLAASENVTLPLFRLSLGPQHAVFDTEIRLHLGRNQSASAEAGLCFACRNQTFLYLRNYLSTVGKFSPTQCQWQKPTPVWNFRIFIEINTLLPFCAF